MKASSCPAALWHWHLQAWVSLLLLLLHCHKAASLRTATGDSMLRSSERIFNVNADASHFNGHHVTKRSADVDDAPISPMTSVFHLNNSHLSLMVNWVGKNSDVVFCLARDQEMVAGSTSNVYRSEDYGETFDDISGKFTLANGSSAVIARYYHHPKSSCRYVFADTVNRYIFTSMDCGASVKAHKVAMVPSVVEFDAAQDGDVFLIHDLEGDEKKLFVTTDFGETFSHVQDYVKSFFFKEISQDGEKGFGARSRLFVQRIEPSGNRTTILSSTNYFQRQLDTSVIFSGALEFELRGDFMFATKPKRSNPKELDLFVSQHGERFVPADFGLKDDVKLEALDYHIIDVTDEGQVMVCVNHDRTLSNLYVSARITPYNVEFSLSLERVMYYNPKVTWTDSWLSDTAGDEPFADVYKVQGLRGIYIASQISEEASRHDEIQPEDLISLMTFDQGGVWSKLAGPETDEEGYRYPGCESGACSLHVSQQLSKRFPSTRSVPIMSSSSAVGIVVATGNVGRNLSHRSDVFLSVDAGLSWHQVLKGSYYFNIGDHGGVIVAAKYYKTEGRTNELLYSTDDGLNWSSVKFYDKPLRIFGLLTEPGENTTVFTMFGTASRLSGGSTDIDWIIVKVDLRQAFDRDCGVDDYKLWSPSDGTVGKHRNCILGRREVYERRIVKARCYSGREFERRVDVETCGCARSDYLCDFGFKLEGRWTNECIKDPDFGELDAYAPPDICPEGAFYNRTRGYVKIRGDTCSGGHDKRFDPQPTLCPVEEEKEFLLVSQREAIVRINLRDLNDVQNLPLQSVKNVITLEFDMEDNCVMYGDIQVDKIFIQCLNGSEPRVLVEKDLDSVEGMAYDWISKTLYFVDGGRETIELVRVDMTYEGRMRKTILAGKTVSKPRGLAVHPVHGYLYFTDWNEQRPQVGRANLDGSDVRSLVTRPHVQWPNGLSIDYIANRVYWVDARQDYIASCDLDGKDFKIVLSKTPELVHPFAVAVHKDLMFWDDWNKKAIYKANKNGGHGVQAVRKNMNGSMDLKIFSSLHRSGTNACAEKGNPCSHLCVGMPNDSYKCMCPDGMKGENDEHGQTVCKCPDGSIPLANGTCIQEGGCTDKQFNCSNKNTVCIPLKWQCDGEDDCGDGSDEIGCAQETCRQFQFQCDNKHCIPDYWKCDFDDDCGDGSDERDCSFANCTVPDQFRCDNGQCISAKWECDMEKDCQDGSDEKNCTAVAQQCKPEEFRCPTGGQCLPKSWKCDGDRDCPDGFDEEDCAGKQCREYQFTCKDGGGCIFDTWRCDGTPDCTDGSDEEDCSEPSESPVVGKPKFPRGNCNDWMFKCANEECIPYWWTCDGSPDCSDASDELECQNKTGSGAPVTLRPPQPDRPQVAQNCHDGQFRCGDGECIYQAWICDGERDCDGGEDEEEELCSNWVRCSSNDFRCDLTGECVDASLLCNGDWDCKDGSDEQGCSEKDDEDDTYSNKEGGYNAKCGTDEFSCDEKSLCVPNSQLCDGVEDCIDGTDELDCHFPVRLGGLEVQTAIISSNNIIISWWMRQDKEISSDAIQFEPCYSVVDSDKWTCEDKLLNSSVYSHKFKNLHPYTNYNFTVRIHEYDKVHQGVMFTTARTASAAPTAPYVTMATFVGESAIRVAWTRPNSPNGRLKSYIVRLQPSGKEWQVGAGRHEVTLDVDVAPGRNYSVSVVALNEEFHGDTSEEVQVTYEGFKVRDKLLGLEPESVGQSYVKLQWRTPERSDVETFLVRIKSANNPFASYSERKVLVSKEAMTAVNITGLAPNETFTFSVSALKDGVTGPVSRVSVNTVGKSLPIPEILSAELTNVRTTVRLSWKLHDNSPTDLWEYSVFYGMNMDEVIHRQHVRKVGQGVTMASIDQLEACESYMFVVAVTGPLGFGHASTPLSKATKYSPGAPPKNLRANVKEHQVNVTWDASCPQIEDPIGYVVTYEDVGRPGVKTTKTLVKSTAIHHMHTINNVHYGSKLNVSVRTDTPDSTSTGPIQVLGPPIPVPFGVTQHLAKVGENKVEQLIYWQEARQMPAYLQEAGFTYNVLMSRNADLSDPELIFPVARPPFDLSNATEQGAVHAGKVYYVSVALMDGDGYVSRQSDPIPVETMLPEEDIVVGRSSMVGVVLVTLLIVLLLVAGLAYYVHRNRRLTRSFQALTSRYNAASGAAILNQGPLDDDDESPIIRGFADDEPLVVT